MTTSTQSQIIKIIGKKIELSPIQIAKMLKISPQAVHKHLKTLISQGMLERRGAPPKTLYRVSATAGHRSFPSLEVKEIGNSVAEVLQPHPGILLVSLFGSTARGTATQRSDLDVLIWLKPNEPFDKHSIWQYWDRQARHLSWKDRASLIVRRWRVPMQIDTLLLDLPEEHIPLVDKLTLFPKLAEAVRAWRVKNGSEKIFGFGGTHAWKYSTQAKSLNDLDFTIEVPNVA
jgi:DNA-binding Lrp family transcriptional regulator